MTRNRRIDIGIWATALLAGAWTFGCLPRTEGLVMSPTRAVMDARKVLFRGVADEDAITRGHAIEALDYTLGAEAAEEFLVGLSDSSPRVRFASAMAIGENEYVPAMAKLTAMAAGAETDKRVLCGVIYALYRLGDDSQMSRMAMLLEDPDPWVRANAAFIMGKSGDPSALQPLKNLISDEQNTNVEIRIMESLAMLGDTSSAMSLEAYTTWQFVDDKIDAIRALARLGGERPRLQLEFLTHNTDQMPLVRVAAAGGLGRMGVFSQTGYNLCIMAVSQPRKVLCDWAEDHRIPGEADIRALQQMAAISLGWIGRPAAVDHLYPLLGDRNGSVRVAAAKSILQLLPSYNDNLLDLTASEPELP